MYSDNRLGFRLALLFESLEFGSGVLPADKIHVVAGGIAAVVVDSVGETVFFGRPRFLATSRRKLGLYWLIVGTFGIGIRN